MKYFAFTLTLVISVALCAGSANAQTLTTLVRFTGTGGTASGNGPRGGLTLSGTRLFGMTEGGGVNGLGNVFSVGTNGTNYQNVLSFTGTRGAANGWAPDGGLTLSGTTLFGMTSFGGYRETTGFGGYGNVFSVGTGGTNYGNLLSFTGTGGSATGGGPTGSLTLSGTTLYGSTLGLDANVYGSIFSVGADGTNFQNLLSFTGSGGLANGNTPAGGLILSGTTLFGMTGYGGANGYGNIYSVGTDGSGYQNLVSFTGTGGLASGSVPAASLTLSGTTLYGMTGGGGANADGNVFSVGTDGTNYHNLLSFTGTSGAAIGLHPGSSLTLSGTTLYGTTEEGGVNVTGNGIFAVGLGNIFSVGIDGSGYRDLYDFTGGADGEFPTGDLALSGGTLFGTTNTGNGAARFGTVFALTLPATPAPEPGTLALVGAAALGLTGCTYRRHRRKRRSLESYS